MPTLRGFPLPRTEEWFLLPEAHRGLGHWLPAGGECRRGKVAASVTAAQEEFSCKAGWWCGAQKRVKGQAALRSHARGPMSPTSRGQGVYRGHSPGQQGRWLGTRVARTPQGWALWTLTRMSSPGIPKQYFSFKWSKENPNQAELRKKY